MFSPCSKKAGKLDSADVEKWFPGLQFNLPTVIAYLSSILVLLIVLHQFSVPLQPLFPLLDMRLKEFSGFP